MDILDQLQTRIRTAIARIAELEKKVAELEKEKLLLEEEKMNRAGKIEDLLHELDKMNMTGFSDDDDSLDEAIESDLI